MFEMAACTHCTTCTDVMYYTCIHVMRVLYIHCTELYLLSFGVRRHTRKYLKNLNLNGHTVISRHTPSFRIVKMVEMELTTICVCPDLRRTDLPRTTYWSPKDLRQAKRQQIQCCAVYNTRITWMHVHYACTGRTMCIGRHFKQVYTSNY